MKATFIANCKRNKTFNLSNLHPQWTKEKHLYINNHLTKQLTARQDKTSKDSCMVKRKSSLKKTVTIIFG